MLKLVISGKSFDSAVSVIIPRSKNFELFPSYISAVSKPYSKILFSMLLIMSPDGFV